MTAPYWSGEGVTRGSGRSTLPARTGAQPADKPGRYLDLSLRTRLADGVLDFDGGAA